MDKLAEQLTNYILRRGAITEDDYAIYKYGLQTGIELSLCVMTCMLIAAYMARCWECILFMVIFFLQRGYIEGIHMRHFYSCYILSCGVVIGGLKFSEITLLSDKMMLLITMVCLLVIVRLARRDFDKTSNDTDFAYYSKKRKKIMIGIAGITVMFYWFHYSIGLRLIVYTEMMMLISTVLKIVSDRQKNEKTSFE